MIDESCGRLDVTLQRKLDEFVMLGIQHIADRLILGGETAIAIELIMQLGNESQQPGRAARRHQGPVEATMQLFPMLHVGVVALGPLQPMRHGQKFRLPFRIPELQGLLERHALEFATHIGNIVQFGPAEAWDPKTALILLRQQTVGRQFVKGFTQRAQPDNVTLLQGIDGNLLSGLEATIENVLAQHLIDAAGVSAAGLAYEAIHPKLLRSRGRHRSLDKPTCSGASSVYNKRIDFPVKT